MLEIIFAVLMVATIVKIADVDNQSTTLWGGVAILTAVLCFAIPIPFFRVFVAAVVTFIAMIVYKMTRR